MTLLERTRSHAPAATRRQGRWRAALGAVSVGAAAAVLSLVLACLPVLAAWFAEERTSLPWWRAVGIGADGWALAHRASVHVDQTTLFFTPLLLTAVPLACCGWAVGRLLRGLPDRPPQRGVWRGYGGAGLLLLVGGYLGAGLLIAYLAGVGAATVRVPTLLPGLVLIPVLGGLVALWRQGHGAAEGPPGRRARVWLREHTPESVRRAAGPAAHGLAGLGLVGVVLVAVLCVVGAQRVGALYGALDAGAVGIAVLTLGQLLALPNLVLWVLGWASGAGYQLGTVSVTWDQAEAGTLPLVPVLGVLPEPGPLPAGAWLVVVLPVLVGAWIGWRSHRATPQPVGWQSTALTAAVACGLTATALAALAWLGNAGVQPGQLSHIGVRPLLLGACLLAELLVGALACVGLRHWVSRRDTGT